MPKPLTKPYRYQYRVESKPLIIIERDRDWFPEILGAFILIAVASLVISSCQPKLAHGAEIEEEKAIKCLLGEARGEGGADMKAKYASLLAHAEAIRNRGHLRGVYGCKSDFSRESRYLEASGISRLARKAWRESAHTNTVSDADHWGSTRVDGVWLKHMEAAGYIRRAKIGETVFYRKLPTGRRFP